MITPNGTMTIQRSAVLDAIKALAFTTTALNINTDDSYSSGYLAGYQAGLKAVVIAIGGEAELKEKVIR